MNCSRILIGSATLALGTMLAWGAAPAVTAYPSTATVAAQGRQRMTPAQSAKRRVTQIDKAVTLTADEKTTIETIYEKAYTDAATARQNGDMQGARDAMTKAETDAKAACTPDQVAKWPKLMMRRPRGGGGGLL
ncbi:MAG: hypothetical protein ACRD01_08255 [Terriglobales bacterium]